MLALVLRAAELVLVLGAAEFVVVLRALSGCAQGFQGRNMYSSSTKHTVPSRGAKLTAPGSLRKQIHGGKLKGHHTHRAAKLTAPSKSRSMRQQRHGGTIL